MIARWINHDAVTLLLCVVVVVLSVGMTPSTGFLHLGSLQIPELCSWRRLLGVSCPGCGLTRSFVFMGHCQLGAAWEINKLGPLLFTVVAAQIPWRSYKLWRRRRDARRHSEAPVDG